MFRPLMLTVATWNVNSIAVRKERLLAFLARERPDFLCLQELKCVDDKFPLAEVVSAGYGAVVYGQKAYNGVAILHRSEFPIAKVLRGFDYGELGSQGLYDTSDDSSRFLAVESKGITIMCAYCPNGESPGSDKYTYKLNWFRRLRRYLDANFRPSDKIALVGDFNIAPDDRDVYDPIALRERLLTTSAERDVLRHVLAFGFYDSFRLHHESNGLFTWWDYRQLAFAQNHGMRIDLVLATRPLAEVCVLSRIDRDERNGDKPSDHVPVISSFDL